MKLVTDDYPSLIRTAEPGVLIHESPMNGEPAWLTSGRLWHRQYPDGHHRRGPGRTGVPECSSHGIKVGLSP
jgi:hypothetical protein